MRFTEIIVRDLGGSPAAVNRGTGELHLAPSFFSLPEAQQRFILWHEWGHYILDTKSELEADKYAFFKYAHEGMPLSKAVLALIQVLDMKNPAHAYRAKQVFKHAICFDYFISPNRTKLKTKESRMEAIQLAFKEKEAQMDAALQAGDIEHAESLAAQLTEMMPIEDQEVFWAKLQDKFQDHLVQLYAGADLEGYEGDDASDELEFDGDDHCLGGDCSEEYLAGFVAGYNGPDLSHFLTKEERAEQQKARLALNIQKQTDANNRKNVKTDSKAAVKYGKSDLLSAKGGAKIKLAEQGISPAGQFISGLVDGAKAVAGMVGKKGTAAEGEQIAAMPDPAAIAAQALADKEAADKAAAEKKKMMWIWIAVAIVLLLAIGGAVWYFKFRKQA